MDDSTPPVLFNTANTLNSFFEEYLGSDMKKLKKYFECKSQLKRIMKKITNDTISKPSIVSELRRTLRKMENLSSDPNFLLKENKKLEEAEVMPDEIQEYLSNTFTTKGGVSKVAPNGHALRGVIKAVMSGVIMDKLRKISTPSKEPILIPGQIINMLDKNVNNWDLNIFNLSLICKEFTLRYVFLYLLHRHDHFRKFDIDVKSLMRFLDDLEKNYNIYNNDYDNSLHACESAFTLNYIIDNFNLKDKMTDIQHFAVLFTALVHEYQDLGLPNSFLVRTDHTFALLYNDISVRENHSISAVFKILNIKENNFLSEIKFEDYREFRKLVIDNCIHMDRTNHFQILKQLRAELAIRVDLDINKVINLLLHVADMSHPAKDRAIHFEWTKRWENQLLKQTKLEHELNIPCSTLCESEYETWEIQLGLITCVIEPMFQELNMILDTVNYVGSGRRESKFRDDSTKSFNFPWDQRILLNKKFWYSKPLNPWSKSESIEKK